MIWYELNYIAICLCNRNPDFVLLLNRLVFYLMSAAMSSMTWDHAMDLLQLLKKNFKNLFFGSLMMRRSFQNLSYLSICSLSQWRYRRIRSNVLRWLELDLACTKVLRDFSQYILRSGSLWYPVSSSMLKNEQFFSLIISKLISTFSLWLYNLMLPAIILFNTSSKNNSRSLTGVTISSSLLNLECFPHFKLLTP